MTWEIFVGITVLVGFMIAVMTPIIKLNGSITKLNCSIDTLNENMATNEKRITEHGKQIDGLKQETVKMNGRIETLEQKIKYFHDA